MAGKAARGAGTIRKKVVTRSGKTYTYWEARVTTGRDPGTGKQVQISITGKTQKEVREKMQAAAVAVDSGTYIQPERMTVSEWLDIWTVAGCHFPAWNPMEQHTIKPHEIKVCFVLRGIPCHALVLHKGKK